MRDTHIRHKGHQKQSAKANTWNYIPNVQVTMSRQVDEGGKAVKKTPCLVFGFWSEGEGDDKRVAMKKEGGGVRVRPARRETSLLE